MANASPTFAPGARVVIREAEWLIRRVDPTATGGQALTVTGISEIVRDKDAIFLTEIDKDIEILDPAETALVPDTSAGYQASLLYMESLLRRKPPVDDRLYIGHKAAMDPVPFQLDAARQALAQPRQRILIADAVGLGKTLECGILLSELIRRGRGKRILVLAVKSMLTQFQMEMWTRFTIPLTRLDSLGIQRIRARIPTNQNPFYHYDKTIISIDTLKSDREYRTYLETAYWDIIVIDEAHNVAERGAAASSLRARLARLLSERSDTLIMLSATPHDGRARSFASLMNMLDPTAIADPDKYGPADIKGLFIRRFKKDIRDQVETRFRQRRIQRVYCDASGMEEAVHAAFADLNFSRIDQKRTGAILFTTVLEKALFSSPAACLQTVRNRIRTLSGDAEPRAAADRTALEAFAAVLEGITPEAFSKFRQLISVIQDPETGFGWTGGDPEDRLVIFTERIETLTFLKTHLPGALGLDAGQVETLHGGLSDIDQQGVVDRFGRLESPLRLLIASDVAAEGINLHYLAHRMIHFDIPWSLMVFQQRNGRIDRYGQTRTPKIVYLLTRSRNDKIRGDTRILELLIRKDQETVDNIGDPGEFMGVWDAASEERLTADAMESNLTPDQFTAACTRDTFDPLAALFGEDPPPTGQTAAETTAAMPSLFPDDYTYVVPERKLGFSR